MVSYKLINKIIAQKIKEQYEYDIRKILDKALDDFKKEQPYMNIERFKESTQYFKAYSKIDEFILDKAESMIIHMPNATIDDLDDDIVCNIVIKNILGEEEDI